MKKNASRLVLGVGAILIVIVACELAAGVPVAIPFVPINVLAQRTQACPVVDETAGSGTAGVAVLAVADIGPDPCPPASLIPLRVAPLGLVLGALSDVVLTDVGINSAAVRLSESTLNTPLPPFELVVGNGVSFGEKGLPFPTTPGDAIFIGRSESCPIAPECDASISLRTGGVDALRTALAGPEPYIGLRLADDAVLQPSSPRTAGTAQVTLDLDLEVPLSSANIASRL